MALADTYLGTLAVERASCAREDFWHDVQRSLLFCPTYPIQCMAYDLSDPRAAAPGVIE